VAVLPPGRWEVDLEVRRDGALLFRTTQDMFVTPGGDAP
jgi:hypothetical protein